MPMALRTTDRLILASASPRRMELLRNLGLSFEIIPSCIEEPACNGETPRDHVLRLAAAKAEAVSRAHPQAWVLAADTIVLIQGEILGKPQTPDDVLRMLGKLSGREHEVFTGFAVARAEGKRFVADAVRSSVMFKEITPDEMAWYSDLDEPYDKAGGYAVQGTGAFFIREIRGSYTNVMGLPLCEVVETLKAVGAMAF